MTGNPNTPAFFLLTALLTGCFLLSPATAIAERDTCDGKRKEQLAEIRAAELSFAAAAQEMSTRDAFLKFLAPESILFRPEPVDGRTHMEGVSPGGGTLEWGPRYVDISQAGDLGFTFGPWVSKDAEGSPVGWGEYISMWQRQVDGSLKVVLDTGTVFPEPGEHAAGGQLVRLTKAAAVPATLTEEMLKDWDSEGGYVINRKGSGARIFRMGTPSFLQTSETDAPDSGLSWKPVGAGLSRSRDLGYSFGTLQTAENELAESYLHIWRCCFGSEWVLLIDVHVGQ